MQLVLVSTVFVTALVACAATSGYRGWRQTIRRWKHNGSERNWRDVANFVALALVSLAVALFIGYAMRNVLTSAHSSNSHITLRLIKSGNTLSFFGILAGLLGKGTERWYAVLTGVVALFLWFAQGISL